MKEYHLTIFYKLQPLYARKTAKSSRSDSCRTDILYPVVTRIHGDIFFSLRREEERGVSILLAGMSGIFRRNTGANRSKRDLSSSGACTARIFPPAASKQGHRKSGIKRKSCKEAVCTSWKGKHQAKETTGWRRAKKQAVCWTESTRIHWRVYLKRKLYMLLAGNL